MKEDTVVLIHVRNEVKKYIKGFFDDEINKPDSYDQFSNICKLDLITIASVHPVGFDYMTEMLKLKHRLKRLFQQENDQNLLGIKIENLILRLITNFGLSTMEKIKEEQIQFLLSLKVKERDIKTSFFWDLVTIKGYFKRRKRIREQRKLNELFEIEVKELFDIFPVLCIIPFLNEIFSGYLESVEY